MGVVVKLFIVIITVLISWIGYKVNNIIKPPPLPRLEETWWGNGDPWRTDKSIRPFRVNISDKILEDLNYRLDHARPFTPPLEGIQQQYGMNTKLLKEIADFWRNKYNWKEREKFFNQYPHYLTSIQGLDIHFIHVKPKSIHHRVLPLLLLHGWPGSVREFYELIPLLTTPQKDRNFVFEVIIPSLPGYGFSQAAVRPGLGAAQMAVVFKNLMKRLGFEKYYIQGGDFGAIILHHLAVLFPEVVLGFHSNMCAIYTPLSYMKTALGIIYPTWFTREDHTERVYPVTKILVDRLRETGYLHIQATKPDTIGVSLNDSPLGLAAYILEKFTTGTNISYQNHEDGGLKNVYDYSDLLDNVMLYWVTGSMPTAMRLYSETFNLNHMSLGITRIPIQVPSGCIRFSNDFYSSDGILNEIYPNLLHLTDHEGGHFAAFQLPKVFAADIFTAVGKFEEFNANNKH
ncbi:juvenile hormone epoxide hydrolase-like protein [Asbolus verrucosus]|uniref:Epoxide hydrolase n=1 Tax=Asbolus verrucosus TaxID=1661398 RepID=A0A482VPK3_ASBVE|nr:juvenile hormone epoxide hydrolase-like protein [Asbolus verrucosus]